MLLEAALRARNARVVYLARATLAVPFGPDCAFPSESKTAMLRSVDGAVGVSQYVADYIRSWSGIEAIHVPISLMEPGPYPELGRFENEFVTLVNPCAVKGIAISSLWRHECRTCRFAAVPTWGTSDRDRAALAQHPNVTCSIRWTISICCCARTRVLLVPSLWAEARSRIVLEAMLRGVPVIASNVGGIPEAKMGVEYLLPVRPIEKYDPRLDERMVPVAEVPPQDIGPWQEALGRLTSDRAHYEDLSRRSREAALTYTANLNVGPFEKFLREVAKPTAGARASERRGRAQAVSGKAPAAGAAAAQNEREPLVSERRRPAKAAIRLFCFPHAGGGAAAFARWQQPVRSESVRPVCPAGRTARGTSAARDDADLVEALGRRDPTLSRSPVRLLRPQHGRGGGVRIGATLGSGTAAPKALFVSGARAPQVPQRTGRRRLRPPTKNL